VTATSQTESTALIEMMLDSARREADADAYDYAIEYMLAVIAVEPNLVLPRLELQVLALSLLSSAQLQVPYVNPVRASVLSSRLRQHRELIAEQFGVDEIASNLLDEHESKVVLSVSRNLTETSLSLYEIETCAEAITLKTARLLQSVGMSDAVARFPALQIRSRPSISSRQYLAFAACATLLIAVGVWFYLPASREPGLIGKLTDREVTTALERELPPPSTARQQRADDAHQEIKAKRDDEERSNQQKIFQDRSRQLGYASAQVAFELGLGAYKAGYYEIAIPALEEAAANGAELNKFFSEFYLARIYSDNDSAFTDHAKAYVLFQQFADDNSDVDPDDGQRAPFVAKALTALAGYLRNGVTEIGLRPDPERAVDYLRHAASFFGDIRAFHHVAFDFLKVR
jgi:hypothetical protein